MVPTSRPRPQRAIINLSCQQGLEWGPPSLVKIIGQLLHMRSSEIRLRKLKLRLRDKRFANHKTPCLPSGSNHFSRSWFFGAVAPRIYFIIYLLILLILKNYNISKLLIFIHCQVQLRNKRSLKCETSRLRKIFHCVICHGTSCIEKKNLTHHWMIVGPHKDYANESATMYGLFTSIVVQYKT